MVLDPITTVVLVVAVLLVLLVLRVPVAFTLMATGALGLLLLRDVGIATDTLSSLPFQATARASLTIVPLFILMGLLAASAGIVGNVYRLLNRFLWRIAGGLGMATILACGFFAAVTGSSVATAATMSKVALPEMQKRGYRTSFAAGIVGAGGTLGVLIPPSIVLVLYGVVTRESIGGLLIAGVLPGLLSAGLYILSIWVKARFDATAAPRPSAAPGITRTERRQAITSGVKALALFGVVVGGIYFGIATPTETAALGTLLALAFALWGFWRPGQQAGQAVGEAASETAVLTGMVFLIVVGAAIFTNFLVVARVPTRLAAWVAALPVSPTIVIALLLISFIPMGMFLDPISIILVAVPIAYPVVVELGFDGLWFGILVVKMIELGLITPPVGINAFVISGSRTGVSLEEAFRGLGWFVPVDLFTVLILFLVPEVVTWLPATMR